MASLIINVVIVWEHGVCSATHLRWLSTWCRRMSTQMQFASIWKDSMASTAVHDLHIWPLSTTRTALTVHLEMPDAAGGDAFLQQVCERLHVEFQIEHPTIQIEQNAEACALAPDPARSLAKRRLRSRRSFRPTIRRLRSSKSRSRSERNDCSEVSS